MVDPIGPRPGFAVERKTSVDVPVEAVVRSAPPRAAGAETPAVAETSVRSLAREMAAKPPVDHERVQQIKRAIAEGRFPIVPAKIADRLIAAQLEWTRIDGSRDDQG